MTKFHVNSLQLMTYLYYAERGDITMKCEASLDINWSRNFINEAITTVGRYKLHECTEKASEVMLFN